MNEQLIPSDRCYDFSMPLNSVSTDAANARAVLEGAADALRVAAAATVYFRFLLGAQLVIVRDNALWRKASLQIGDTPAESWTDWVSNHLPQLIALRRRSAFGAIQIAESKALQSLGEDGLRGFENLANAHLIARLEGQIGTEKAKALLADAMTLPVDEFQERAGVPAGRGQTRTVTTTPEIAKILDRINGRVKSADQDSLERLAELIDNDVATLAGDNPDDIVGFVLAAITHEIGAQQEEVQTLHGE